MNFSEINKNILPYDEAAVDAAKARWDSIAKPVGSLGEFESHIIKIAGISGSVEIGRRAAIILAADNGVTARGVASTPPEITAVMAGFMARKRSAACIMASSCGAEIVLRDMGMLRRVEGVDGPHIANGTADITQGAAMTDEQAREAVQYGIDLVRDLKACGFQLLAAGEMGIGNTTTSSAIASVLLDRPPREVTGRGVKLDDAGLSHKITCIEQAISINKPDGADAFDTLRKLGGFDIAGMAGLFIGGALYGVPVIIDGFISGVSALVAARLCPRSVQAMLASHVSAEPGAELALNALGLCPVIHAGMRLGEGTGAVAIIPLLDMAAAVYHDLMTFADIGMTP
ncbi:MAG: nicotinate-nucleotide--dimethylbenzimidazole phosphoribosyltransferase [Clostridiales bacterium]|jgi:nicotinate-nucleotide--dimethylbenzimidazole phosphoribosyltransferase|nr:nicotinate-nucleotide--dimethylbenzimidazole phosphoribosyltransferase [Clostridiales bacterium]